MHQKYKLSIGWGCVNRQRNCITTYTQRTICNCWLSLLCEHHSMQWGLHAEEFSLIQQVQQQCVFTVGVLLTVMAFFNFNMVRACAGVCVGVHVATL